MANRLAIITTHPIQYNAPLFTVLARRGQISIKVFYTWGEKVLKEKYDPGFGKNIQWDVPLLEGYDYEFINNIAKHPGTHHFKGIINPTLIDSIKKWKADAILVYGWGFKSHLGAIRYFHKRIPVYFRGDSTIIQQKNNLKTRIKSIFLRWVYSHIDKALYVGRRNREYYKAYGMKEDQLIFCPHAVDNERFMNDEEYCNEVLKWKSELKVDSLSAGFLYAGKLDDNKNVRLLLKTFAEIKQNYYLIIAGNGILENELKATYSGYSNIHFLPFQNQRKMPVVYRLADVFVLPSKTETWGLGINEAMACSRAVLVSENCGGAADLVKNGVNGFTFKSESEADLRDKIITIINNKNNLVEMGKSSLNIIKNWNYEKYSLAIESILNSFRKYSDQIETKENIF
jgi:glycosyltransferase involved in cell wall biosynthesis